MSTGDWLLSILLGVAAGAVGVLTFREHNRWVRVAVAAGCAIALVTLIQALGLAFDGPDTAFVPGRGVVTIAPPGPSGGPR